MLKEPLVRIVEARHHDPFEVLGRHLEGKEAVVRCFLPKAERVQVVEAGLELKRIPYTDLFEGRGKAEHQAVLDFIRRSLMEWDSPVEENGE